MFKFDNPAQLDMDNNARVEAFVQQDQERNAFIYNIIQENERLQADVDELRADLGSERESRRMWQSRVDSADIALRELKLNLKKHEFVLVILDGDGAIFLDEHYAGGRDGGAQAAHLLHALIKSELVRRYPDEETTRWQIVVHIMLSARGLGRQLKTCGIIANEDKFIEFSQGWVSHAHTYWTDVGYGKERADHKVREALRWYVGAIPCKHVFFGPCSDTGYITTLEDYMFERRLSTKITLLETRPAEVGFTKLPYDIVSTSAIFRRTDLQPQRSKLEAARITTPTDVTETSVVAGASRDTTGSHQEGTAVPTWASISRANTRIRSFEASEPKSAYRYILLNVKDQRLDIDLEQPSAEAQQRFKDRFTDRHPCNHHYLLGQCDAGSSCRYLHATDLSKSEYLVLQHKARGLVCYSGSVCRDFSCIHGHQCKYKNDCTLKPCRFEQFHGMDIRGVRKLKENCLEPTQIATA